MSNLQFVFYDLTVIFIIAHFLDSCKEQEWNEPMYFGSYVFWLVSTVLIIAFTIIGIIPVYIGNNSGNIFSIIVGISGLGAAGYHMPLNYLGKSETCNNNFSYGLMYILSAFCLILIYATIKNIYNKDTKNNNENIKNLIN